MIKTLRKTNRDIRLLIISMHDEALYADRVLRAGGDGYIMKQEDPEEVIHAIRDVASDRADMRLAEIIAEEVAIQRDGLPTDAAGLRRLKAMGFSDKRLATLAVRGAIVLVGSASGHRPAAGAAAYSASKAGLSMLMRTASSGSKQRHSAGVSAWTHSVAPSAPVTAGWIAGRPSTTSV